MDHGAEEPKILTRAAYEERQLLVDAMARLGCSRAAAVRFVQDIDSGVPVDRSFVPIKTFRLLSIGFDEPDADWEERNVAAVRKLCRAEMKKYRRKFPDSFGPAPPQRRGPGKTKRNAEFDQRYEWAVLWLLGCGWKDIAIAYNAQDPIKAADRIRQSVVLIFKAAQIAYRE
ncbi:MAG: hypothetical protein C5B58_10920 [Acidobacteria bacterium]|nr:MAG: hypothetical protein C5B58_10920 [Acidobacteriota bacterium]